MAKRVKIEDEGTSPIAVEKQRVPRGDGLFIDKKVHHKVFRSGSTMLDLVNGGGWALGGVVNVVGDKSTGKTQLITEAMANYHHEFPDAPIRYVDAESAYDEDYGRLLGCPPTIKFTRAVETVEAFAADFEAFAKSIPDGGQGFYGLDSLDSLTDNAEVAREVGEASYGMAKAKLLSEFFRKTVAVTARKQITLFVISQVRSAVGVSFGRPTTRAGGKALDFYALQVVYLTHLKRLDATRNGVKRVVGIDVQAKNEKNKISVPFRECRYPIIFNFGIDDVASMVAFLIETKRYKELFDSEKGARSILTGSREMPQDEWISWRKKLRKVCRRVWAEIEKDFAQTKRKYVQ